MRGCWHRCESGYGNGHGCGCVCVSVCAACIVEDVGMNTGVKVGMDVSSGLGGVRV